MKRIVSLVVTVALMLCLCACGSSFPKELEPYTIPWKLDAVKQAQEDGCIHYYFMSAQGLEVNTSSMYPEKWGDSCLIVFPEGSTMLVDTGLNTYAQVLVENLKRLGIQKLDYLLLTHPHNDHCGGALEENGVIDSFPIGQVYHNGVYNGDWKTAAIIDDVCKEKNIPVGILKQGDTLEIGPVSARVLWPVDEIVGKTYTSTGAYDPVEDVNNSSILIRFDYLEHSSLFTGDLFASGEEEIVKMYAEEKEVLKAEFMKAMHHGSMTSNTAQFLFAVKPTLAVSTGCTPITADVRDIYDLVNAQLLDDKYCGYIHVWSDGSQMSFEISPKQ